MRPQKLTPEHMLNTCALQFKAHGYAGTSMEMLAKACGLSKASFYYYYPNKQALLMQDVVDPSLVQRVITEGYAADLSDDEVDQIGRDPFLVAYALSGKDRCVVTVETPAPRKQRQNRKLPDVCQTFGQNWCNPFAFNRALGFRTQWKQSLVNQGLSSAAGA